MVAWGVAWAALAGTLVVTNGVKSWRRNRRLKSLPSAPGQLPVIGNVSIINVCAYACTQAAVAPALHFKSVCSTHCAACALTPRAQSRGSHRCVQRSQRALSVRDERDMRSGCIP